MALRRFTRRKYGKMNVYFLTRSYSCSLFTAGAHSSLRWATFSSGAQWQFTGSTTLEA